MLLKIATLITISITTLTICCQTIEVESTLQSLIGEHIFLEHPDECGEYVGHTDNMGFGLEKEKEKNLNSNSSWARTLRFSVKFDNDCDYNLFNFNQKDWNKLYSIYHVRESDANSIRLGWRWNLEKDKMEIGLYGHIHHKYYQESYVGREFLFVNDVNLNTWFDTELIFGMGGIGIIVNGKGGYIKRRGILPEGNFKTGYRKTSYFGGQECAPHDMRIKTSKAKGDKITNWHGGACYKTFARSIFYSDENLAIFAANEITMSQQVYRGQYDLSNADPLSNTIPSGQVEGNEIPWFESDGERYVKVESGSVLRCYAGEKITLLPGFHAQNGSFFHAVINPDISCATFEKSLNNSDDEENDNGDKEITEKTETLILDEKMSEEQVEEFEKQQYVLYPNPSSGEFSILSMDALSQLAVFSDNGKQVLIHQCNGANKYHFNMSHLEKGVYFTEITLQNGSVKKQKIVLF